MADESDDSSINVLVDINQEIELTFEKNGQTDGSRFVRLSVREARALAAVLNTSADLAEAGGFMRSTLECESMFN